MKVTQAHYQYMLEAMRPLSDRFMAHRLYLQNDSRVKDVEKRLRWDAFNGAKLTRFACDELYSYCNDDHIDTALRAIMKELEA
jgi:hypothetical protein